MILRRRSDGRIVVSAPAKVNLFLEVLGKRADGYHELETLFVAVNLYDTLVFKEDESGAVNLRCDDVAIPRGPENLVVRSALLIREETGSRRGVSIWLRKRIPSEAGLGGGSSDAAATFEALNQLWKLGLGLPELADLGARVGSDVPFFFHTPAAIGRGRGERLEPLRLARPIHLVLVCPNEGVSTAEVFSRLKPSGERRAITPLVDCLSRSAPADCGLWLFNRLEATACELCPAIRTAQEALRAVGLAGPLMSGSGSAVFGLASSRLAGIEAAAALRERFPGRVYVVRSTPEGAHQ